MVTSQGSKPASRKAADISRSPLLPSSRTIATYFEDPGLESEISGFRLVFGRVAAAGFRFRFRVSVPGSGFQGSVPGSGFRFLVPVCGVRFWVYLGGRRREVPDRLRVEDRRVDQRRAPRRH